MAATMDTHMPQQHDDLHLMGLQELDSHLSIFESSNMDMESSTGTPESTSNYADAINTSEQLTTIVVESPDEVYSPSAPYGSRARPTDPKLNAIQYVFALSYLDLSFIHQPVVLGSFRDSF
tara:strand:+ start:72 stop:434 length:363 start_codon:yes stop_codon:yes gene_type:complete